MANLSQCLDDAPLRGFRSWEPSPAQAYSEAQRLALEVLVASGLPAFQAFLRGEKMRAFLSEPEIRAILQAVVPPPGAEEGSAEQTLNGSLDCSSLTYFPLQSDIEPPVLELGWPAFVSGSYRGLTRVETYFQPSFGEVIYPCKEAVRKQIRSAREVIAIVMDSFTDMDIFYDLHDACRKRLVPVYILLDQAFLCHFMEMCKNLEFCPEQEYLMRVRTIAGNTYYARSGAKIIGSVHEKFMLIDGIKVTTGSYSFTWTDGKLNSSNLLVLSGQVVEHFDLEFRILYAQSKPINTKLPSICKNSGVLDHLTNRSTPCKDFTVGNLLRAEFARLSCSPKMLEKEVAKGGRVSAKRPHLDGSSVGEEEGLLNGIDTPEQPKERQSQSTQTEPFEEKPTVTVFNSATQTSVSVATAGTQTTARSRMVGTQTVVMFKTVMTQTGKNEASEVALDQRVHDQTVCVQRIPDPRVPPKEASPVYRKSTSKETSPVYRKSTSKEASPIYRKTTSKEASPVYRKSMSTSSSSRSLSSLSSQCSRASSVGSLTSLRSLDYPCSHRADYFRNLNKEREFHYSVIRSKLNHMVSMLSRRGNVAENYTGCRPMRCNLKPRRQISTSLINLRDFALYSSNDCF
ncbi:protein FAM83D [Eublepharis macularius]|uniref:Protein FAM83D n=1 Tax=Eublepharis macularius TaxID=481883 RepID=A0AA97JJ91_EUBMA|nr:protein FAM83D [Eublepharis macularius]